jgi:hypothetical protein
MTARWSFEALAVAQFKDNSYEKNYFRQRAEVSGQIYNMALIDRLNFNLQEISRYKDSAEYRNDVETKLRNLNYYIDEMSAKAGIVTGQRKSALAPGKFTSETERETRKWLDSLKVIYSEFKKQAVAAENSVSNSLTSSIGREGLWKLRDNYENKWLRDLVLNHGSKEVTDEVRGKIIRKFEPGYMNATSVYGRAHFYAPFKKIGNMEIDTWWFNMIVIWIGSVALFLVLYYNLIRKLLEYIETLRLPKTEI